MNLQSLIEMLENHPDQEQIVPIGFSNPHCYRGYYRDLAFEPTENVKVKDMLAEAKSAIGQTFYGYKGGEFTMNGDTDVWLANHGDIGEGIGRVFVSYMLGTLK